MTASRRRMEPSLVEDLVQRESAAAAVFESRWTRQALRRVDPTLDWNLDAQRQLFSTALAQGHDGEIRRQGEAMVRGWQAAVRAMSDAGCEDDAYLLGNDPASGARVAISAQRSAAQRVRERYGEEVVFLTPDEVAARIAPIAKSVAMVKALWPGAEIVQSDEEGEEADG